MVCRKLPSVERNGMPYDYQARAHRSPPHATFPHNQDPQETLTEEVDQSFSRRLCRKSRSFILLTQIYEVATPAEADAISGFGVDHVGVLIGDGAFPRELSVREAAEIMAAVRAPSKLSALFLSANVALIERMALELSPPILHLGASSELLTPDHVVNLRKALPGIKFMRSVPVTGSEAIAVAKAYDGIVDWILLDSHRVGDTQIGALGVTHDWNISGLLTPH